MALARPIVVTSGSGFEDFFTDEHDSLMVPPGEPEPLARAIVRLLRDPSLRSRLSARAAQTIQRYRPEPVTRQHLEFFERVAGRA
jgi:glycogen synthase